MKNTMTLAIAVALAIGSRISLAQSDDVPIPFVPSQHRILVLAAEEYGAPVEQLMNVGHCESGSKNHYFDQSAIGAAGEIGAFQYFQGTWDFMSKAMGQKLDISSFDDQAKLTAWVFKNHPEWKSQWSTWRVWYGQGKHRCRD